MLHRSVAISEGRSPLKDLNSTKLCTQSHRPADDVTGVVQQLYVEYF
jgi:hypothetical protein